MYSCVTNSPKTLAASNNRHLLSHSFYGNRYRKTGASELGVSKPQAPALRQGAIKILAGPTVISKLNWGRVPFQDCSRCCCQVLFLCHIGLSTGSLNVLMTWQQSKVLKPEKGRYSPLLFNHEHNTHQFCFFYLLETVTRSRPHLREG